MPILSNDYKPPFLFKYRHINTIYSSLFRKIKPAEIEGRKVRVPFSTSITFKLN
ncbi:MAG: hypothetical protein HN631_06090 [Flavobacteriaceae bacterium]|nr:hypothetical protein [Flavobacteriaceae bacterium]